MQPLVYYAGHKDSGFMLHALQRLEVSYRNLYEPFGLVTPSKIILKSFDVFTQSPGDRSSVVISLQNSNRLASLVEHVLSCPLLVNNLNNGQSKLFIDFSNESSSLSLVNELATCLSNKGVSRKGVVFLVCQNRILESYCSEHGIIKSLNFDFFFVITYLLLIQEIDESYSNMLLQAIDHYDSTAGILCLNATPRFHRLVLLIYLFSAGLFCGSENDSFVSFPGYDYAKKSGLDPSAIRNYFTHDFPELLDVLTDLEKLFPLIADKTNKTGNELAFVVDISFYLKTKLSVVTETGYGKEHIRITEKTLKPLLLGHPLYVLGHPGTASLINSLGFRLVKPDVQQVIDKEMDLKRKAAIIADSSSKFLIDYSSSEAFRREIKEVAYHNIQWARDGFLNQYFRNYVMPLWTELAWH